MRGRSRPNRYWIYILSSPSRTTYVGFTNDRDRRISEHKAFSGSGFAAKYRLTELVYFEEFADVREAIEGEKQIKSWRREKKIALIEAINPRWTDLSTPEKIRDSSLRSE